MLYIRADMNNTIATGHVMRCLSIADAARKLGQETTFLLADEQAVELLEQRGYAYQVLHTNWQRMEEELPLLDTLIKSQGIQSILIDSYQVTPQYLEGLSRLVKTIYLDDVNAFPYPVHAVLCYAVYAEQMGYQKSLATQYFLGPQYAPLRQVFCQQGEKEIAEKVNRLLLLSGGTDPYHILEQLLDRLAGEDYQQITVICGRYYTKYEELCQHYQENKNIQLLQSVDNIQDYMREADITISAGGSTLYELSALGTPAISYALADNQLDNVKTFAAMELIDYAGDVRTEPVVSNILSLLQRYREDQQLRGVRSKRMREVIDGKGAERIVKIWLAQ